MAILDLKIDNCFFPSDYLYDLENLIWIKFVGEPNQKTNVEKEFLIGLTPIYSYLAGKINNLKLKPVGTLIQKGKSIGFIESLVHFGTIRCPLAGKISEINHFVVDNPKVINDSPFGNGWIAKIITSESYEDNMSLKKIDDCKQEMLSQIRKYHVKCFKLFPDFQIFEIGTECAATLAKLDEFMNKSMKKGQVIRLVSDDPTADLELLRWAEQNQEEIVEIIKEQNSTQLSTQNSGNKYLFNIIIRKKKG